MIKILILMSIALPNAFRASEINPNDISSPDSDKTGVDLPKYIETGPETRSVVLPHVICTGLAVSNLIQSCFPVGCICARGAGVCNLLNKCVKKSVTISILKPQRRRRRQLKKERPIW